VPLVGGDELAVDVTDEELAGALRVPAEPLQVGPVGVDGARLRLALELEPVEVLVDRLSYFPLKNPDSPRV
jgi:hypothetical protein